ncbi:MAG: RluA family pseudouridine synthase [Bacilli bacterium]|nr:RluA family pseudouridine synthase [Bacilli bacterium]
MNQKVTKEIQLLEFLLNNFNDLSNKKIKALLKYENILVNNKVQTKYDFQLKKNDIVSIKEYKTKKHDENLNIIFEDKDIIVLNKPSGLLTISTKKEKEKTLYHFVSEYVKQDNKKNNIFVVHRLDKDTSGIIVFAKTEKIKNLYQNNWEKLIKTRSYIAIVEGKLDKKEDVIQSYLTENANNMVYSTNKYDGKLAITKYKVIKENNKYSMLHILIETGRKNQIRVHMSEIDHPIVGDKKYGTNNSPIKRLGLHANKLEIINPVTNKLDKYEADMPLIFKKVFKD